MPPIDPGHPAPPFTLRDQHGHRRILREFRGRPVVLFFYPEDSTPLCTKQACQFRDMHAEFAALGVAVLGISPQDVASKRAFAADQRLPYPLLADVPGDGGEPPVSLAYGAFGDKNMYGRIVRAMLRTTYLIAPDGTVARRWDRVKTPGHAQAVLDAVRALLASGTPAPRSPPRGGKVGLKRPRRRAP
jgi:peroxiredoxin Q/BCP